MQSLESEYLRLKTKVGELSSLSTWRVFKGGFFNARNSYRVRFLDGPSAGYVNVKHVTSDTLIFDLSISEHVLGVIEAKDPKVYTLRNKYDMRTYYGGQSHGVCQVEELALTVRRSVCECCRGLAGGDARNKAVAWFTKTTAGHATVNTAEQDYKDVKEAVDQFVVQDAAMQQVHTKECDGWKILAECGAGKAIAGATLLWIFNFQDAEAWMLANIKAAASKLALCTFLLSLGKDAARGYINANLVSYHNEGHAIGVTNMVGLILQGIALGDAFAPSGKQKVEVLLAAACHDLHHPGFHNRIAAWHKVYSRDDHGAGVLEAWHGLCAENLKGASDFDDEDTDEDVSIANIKTYIMGTESVEAKRVCDKIGATPDDVTTEEKLKFIVHCADVSMYARPLPTIIKTEVPRVCVELYQESDFVKRMFVLFGRRANATQLEFQWPIKGIVAEARAPDSVSEDGSNNFCMTVAQVKAVWALPGLVKRCGPDDYSVGQRNFINFVCLNDWKALRTIMELGGTAFDAYITQMETTAIQYLSKDSVKKTNKDCFKNYDTNLGKTAGGYAQIVGDYPDVGNEG